jgi:hypothetical protein
VSRRQYGARAGDVCPAGLHALPVGWFPSKGCRGCLNVDALGQAVAVLTTVLPSAPEDVARNALTAVTDGGSVIWLAQRYRLIRGYLTDHPDGLTSGASTTPVDVARLITQLRQLGQDDVSDPRCADCARSCFPRMHRPDGQRICVACDGRRRHVACGRCGNVRSISVRMPDGMPVCQACHKAEPANWSPCGRCGTPGPFQGTVRGVRVASCCYLKPHERCSVCGLGRAVSVYASGKATCTGCANAPHEPCILCGLDAPTGSGEPVCLRCHDGVNQPCRVCATMTVSRDRDGAARCSTCITRMPRKCGGCGSQRVIARRADGDQPDLCVTCWQGPTVVCDGCGRLRPCRGERAGRMLCKGCTPRRKDTCAYCGHHRAVTVIWADGPACASCYRRFMHAKDVCPTCGQYRRLLPYIGQLRPVCAPCAGAPPGPVCAQCGNEDWLYQKDRCARCVLIKELTTLLGDADHRDRFGLQPLFDTLTQADNPTTIIQWARPSAKGTAHSLLSQLGRGEIRLTHEALDALNTPGNGGTANHLDAILTAIGALPSRDLELARLERAVPAALAAVPDPDHRAILRAYATWDVLRHARTVSKNAPLTPGARHGAMARLASAGHLLTWLADKDLDLAGCRPADLDVFLVGHPTRRNHLPGFLAWAYRTRRSAKLTITSGPKPLPRTIPADDEHRWSIASVLLHDGDHTPADRVAGLLVLLFGQRPHRIARLTVDDVGIHDEQVTITLGSSPIDVPEPMATHVRQLIATRRTKVAKRITAPGPWLFPSQHPDRPALSETITHRLQRVGIQPTAHRAAALLHLAAELPPAVLGGLLGLGRTAVQEWSTLAARPWASYVADRLIHGSSPGVHPPRGA